VVSGVSDLPPLLKAGDSLGGYILTAYIGGGPAAHAFRAEGRAKQVVVVRVLRPEFAADPAWASHFLTASAALSRIDHPTLGKVLEAGTADNVPYVVEEDLGLRHVIHLIFNEGVRQGEAVGILASAADLAAACHCVSPPVRVSGMRPTDVFLVDQTAKVCHCGVLKSPHIEVPPGPGRTSVPPSQCLAPEVLHGGEPTVAADVYSMGLLLLRMLRGNWGVAAAVRALRLGVGIDQVIETIEDPGVDLVLKRCLAPEPEDRFASAEELLDALMALRKHNPARGPRPRGQVLAPAPMPVPPVPPTGFAPRASRRTPAAVAAPEPVVGTTSRRAQAVRSSAPTGDTITVRDLLAGAPNPAVQDAPPSSEPARADEIPSPPRPRECLEAELAPALSTIARVVRLRELGGRPAPLSIGEFADLAAARAAARPAGRAEAPTERELAYRYPAPRVTARPEVAKPRRRMPGAFSRAPSEAGG